MNTKRIPLVKLLGFQVWIDWSWLILALLITWTLAEGLFPARYPDHDISAAGFWSMAIAGALGLFASIILHELGHSVVARRYGVEMRGITLFIFGGVAEMTDEPPSASAEFFIAIAGPVVSVLIGVSLLGMTALGAAMGWPLVVIGVTGWLGWINIVLAVFNLVPAFPLDGGRVLRAALWQWKGDLRLATRISSTIGGLFGIFLIIIGVMSFFGGAYIGGMWWAVLGLFLRGAAASSYQQVLIKSALDGESVSRFMCKTLITIPAETTITELIENYFHHHYHKMYPVTEGGDLIGFLSIDAVKSIPRERWSEQTVREITTGFDDTNTVRPTDDAMRALDQITRSGVSRVLVVDQGRLCGMLTLKDLVRFLSISGAIRDAA